MAPDKPRKNNYNPIMGENGGKVNGKSEDKMTRNRKRIRRKHQYRCRICGCYLDPAEGRICQECAEIEMRGDRDDVPCENRYADDGH